MKGAMKFSGMLILMVFVYTGIRAQSILFDNGPFVTHPGAGPGGSDISLLSLPLVNYGYGNQLSNDQRLADDFMVNSMDGWFIDSIVFFQYQTGSSTISTMTATNLCIWQNSSVVWGDASTNRLIRSVWTGCYRSDDLSGTQRPVMRNVCSTPGLYLAAGDYILDWQADGSLASGPWNIPVTINGQLTTGNGQGYSGGSWSYIYGDTLEIYRQGLAFVIYGREGGYPSSVTINQAYSFSNPYDLASYRIIGLPGNLDIALSELISGTPGKNWMAFWDNGDDENYMKAYDGSSFFRFRPGNAFWITSESSIQINKTVGSVPLNSFDAFDIPVNKESWTLISNPFEKKVYWASVIQASGLAENTVLWDWQGTWRTATEMAPGKGYYFYDAEDIDALSVPYYSIRMDNSSGIQEKESDFLTLELAGGALVSNIRVEFHPDACDGFDFHDVPMPAGDFETVGIRLMQPDINGKQRELYVDSRQSATNGQAFQIKLINRSNHNIKLTCTISENMANEEIRLISLTRFQWTDLKARPVIEIPKGTEIRTLLIGNREYIENQTTKILSATEPVFRCTPNPVKSDALIGFNVPVSSEVKVSVYDVTGRMVIAFPETINDPGYYELSLNRGSLMPGIYFIRMNAQPLSNGQGISKVIRVQFL